MRLKRNNHAVPSLSTTIQHLIMITCLFSIPKSLQGDVVECGCFNGSSTINLSIVCDLVGRKLFVCDSFLGLPEPGPGEKITLRNKNAYYNWRKGEFGVQGGLERVKANIVRFGCIDACRFVPGYFSETLSGLETDSIVLIFEDADLMSSVRDCIRYLWAKLCNGCRFYSHEPWSVEIVGLFFDENFWHEHLKEDPPGFIGASFNNQFVENISQGLGYAEKIDAEKIRRSGKRVMIKGSL